MASVYPTAPHPTRAPRWAAADVLVSACRPRGMLSPVTDPEALHAQLTSGDPGRVRQLGTDLLLAAHDVDDSAERLTQGLARPIWDNSLAQLAFALKGQQAFLQAATASWRLSRGFEATSLAAEGYDDVQPQADHVIGVWRRRSPDLDPFQEELLRFIVVTHLQVLAIQYGAVLTQAIGLLGDADEDLEDWFEHGAARDYWFAVQTGAGSGPRIPDSVLNGDQGGWTQQGLAYDPATGLYLVTSYRDGEHGDDSGLTIVDGQNGVELNHVQLTSPSASDPVQAPSHSGGVAVNGDDVYVVSSESGGPTMYHYSLSDLQAAEPGDEVRAISKTPVPASSYVTVADGQLYLGDFGNNALYSYPVGAVPALESGTYAGEPVRYEAPEGSNGVVVLPGQMVFSTQGGRAEESSLVTVDSTDGSVVNTFPLGNMAEEIELVDGQIVGVSESGSDPYSPWDPDTKDPEDLWAQTHMFALPVEMVTDDGYQVSPQSLREASKEFDAATQDLQGLAGRVGSLHLPARVLGDVPQAGALSSAMDTFLDATATAVRAGGKAATGAADGLRTTADGYEATDGAVADGFRGLGSVLPGLPHY